MLQREYMQCLPGACNAHKGVWNACMEHAMPTKVYVMPAKEYEMPTKELVWNACKGVCNAHKGVWNACMEHAIPTKEYEIPTREHAMPTKEYEMPTKEYAMPAWSMQYPQRSMKYLQGSMQCPQRSMKCLQGSMQCPQRSIKCLQREYAMPTRSMQCLQGAILCYYRVALIFDRQASGKCSCQGQKNCDAQPLRLFLGLPQHLECFPCSALELWTVFRRLQAKTEISFSHILVNSKCILWIVHLTDTIIMATCHHR